MVKTCEVNLKGLEASQDPKEEEVAIENTRKKNL